MAMDPFGDDEFDIPDESNFGLHLTKQFTGKQIIIFGDDFELNFLTLLTYSEP